MYIKNNAFHAPGRDDRINGKLGKEIREYFGRDERFNSKKHTFLMEK